MLSSILRTRKQLSNHNEDGFMLSELVVAISLSMLVIIMSVAAVNSSNDARTILLVKSSIIDSTALIDSYRSFNVLDGRGQVSAPKDLTFVSFACEESTQVISSIPLSVSSEVCLKVTGTTSSYVVTAYASTQGNPTVLLYESDADYVSAEDGAES